MDEPSLPSTSGGTEGMEEDDFSVAASKLLFEGITEEKEQAEHFQVDYELDAFSDDEEYNEEDISVRDTESTDVIHENKPDVVVVAKEGSSDDENENVDTKSISSVSSVSSISSSSDSDNELEPPPKKSKHVTKLPERPKIMTSHLKRDDTDDDDVISVVQCVRLTNSDSDRRIQEMTRPVVVKLPRLTKEKIAQLTAKQSAPKKSRKIKILDSDSSDSDAPAPFSRPDKHSSSSRVSTKETVQLVSPVPIKEQKVETKSKTDVLKNRKKEKVQVNVQKLIKEKSLPKAKETKQNVRKPRFDDSCPSCQSMVPKISSVGVYCSAECITKQAEIASQLISDPNHRIMVIESSTGRLLTNASAPPLKLLEKWLEKHPTFKPVLPKAIEADSQADKSVIATPDPSRLDVRKQLKDALSARVDKVDDLMLTNEEVKSIAMSIELELNRKHQGDQMAYIGHFKNLIHNIKNPLSLGLFRRILSQELSATKLISLSGEQLSSREYAGWNLNDNKSQDLFSTATDVDSLKRTWQASLIKKQNSSTASSTPSMEIDSLFGELMRDTTKQHKSHLFDLNCAICTGKHQGQQPAPTKPKAVPEKPKLPPPSSQAVIIRPISPTSAATFGIQQNMAPMPSFADPLGLTRSSPGHESESDSIPAPPPPMQKPVLPPKEPAKLKLVWEGKIHMPEFCEFHTRALLISGNGTRLHSDLDNADCEVVGRIAPDVVWNYIKQIRQIPSKELVVLRLSEPKDKKEHGEYRKLFDNMIKKRRCCVVKSSKVIKDFYLFALARTESIPKAILPFKGYGLSADRKDYIIGIIVRNKPEKATKTDSKLKKASTAKTGEPANDAKSVVEFQNEQNLFFPPQMELDSDISNGEPLMPPTFVSPAACQELSARQDENFERIKQLIKNILVADNPGALAREAYEACTSVELSVDHQAELVILLDKTLTQRKQDTPHSPQRKQDTPESPMKKTYDIIAKVGMMSSTEEGSAVEDRPRSTPVIPSSPVDDDTIHRSPNEEGEITDSDEDAEKPTRVVASSVGDRSSTPTTAVQSREMTPVKSRTPTPTVIEATPASPVERITPVAAQPPQVPVGADPSKLFEMMAGMMTLMMGAAVQAEAVNSGGLVRGIVSPSKPTNEAPATAGFIERPAAPAKVLLQGKPVEIPLERDPESPPREFMAPQAVLPPARTMAPVGVRTPPPDRFIPPKGIRPPMSNMAPNMGGIPNFAPPAHSGPPPVSHMAPNGPMMNRPRQDHFMPRDRPPGPMGPNFGHRPALNPFVPPPSRPPPMNTMASSGGPSRFGMAREQTNFGIVETNLPRGLLAHSDDMYSTSLFSSGNGPAGPRGAFAAASAPPIRPPLVQQPVPKKTKGGANTDDFYENLMDSFESSNGGDYRPQVDYGDLDEYDFDLTQPKTKATIRPPWRR